VRRVDVGGTDLGLAVRMASDVVELEVENAGPAVTLTFRPALAPGSRVRTAEVSDGTRPRVGRPRVGRPRVGRPRVGALRGGPYELTVVCPAARTTRVTLRLRRQPR
jgi:hypothetical protein